MRVDLDKVIGYRDADFDSIDLLSEVPFPVEMLDAMIDELQTLRHIAEIHHNRINDGMPCVCCAEEWHGHEDNCPVKALEAMK